jgi:hypothetical protein
VAAKKWSQQRVIKELRAWDRAPGSQEVDISLYAASRRHCGGWHQALVMAGLLPPDFQPTVPSRWTKDRVIREILKLHETGKPRVSRAQSNLTNAAKRLFGTWNNAVLAAGLEPSRRRRWSPQRVLADLQALDRQALLDRGLYDVDSRLVAAAWRYFGTLQNALVTAGVLAPGETIGRARRWTKQHVIEAIQDMYLAGGPVTSQVDRGLNWAACSLFGSWRAAVEAAGFNLKQLRDINKQRRSRRQVPVRPFRPPRRKLTKPNTPRRRGSWTKQRVIAVIRARHRRGLTLAAQTRGIESLVVAAQRCFGSWTEAKRTAGLKVRTQSKWNRKKIIEAIQQRHEKGLSVRSDSRLVAVARRHFGSWLSALDAAGLRPPPQTALTKRDVVAAIRQRHRQGRDLHSVWREDPKLYRAARKRFGAWRDALRAAGAGIIREREGE